MTPRQIKISKFLSLVLRHDPAAAGIVLDEQGWTSIDALLSASSKRSFAFSQVELMEVVKDNDKQRFALSEDGMRIRANQGHSIKVELGLPAQEPPAILFHGTVSRFADSIRTQGLLRGKRQHVHLSLDRDTATRVGQRRGDPIIIEIDSGRMNSEGFVFFQSENGVWLTEHVPARFLRWPGLLASDNE